MIKKNRVLEKLRRGEPVIGCQIRSRSPMIAEIYGQCGFDYVFIEGEHFPYNPESVLQMVQGCECGNIEPILRIVDHDPGKILQFLDMGVTGLLFPHCDTPEQAKAIMEAGKYKPLGSRGFSNTSRSTGYGALPMEEYKAMANQNTMLIPMIESRRAVESLDEILAAGVDAIHLGPGDLAESYGFPVGHKAVQDAIDLVLAKAAEAGVPVGTVSANPGEAVQNLRRGFRMISYSSDLMLLREAGSRAIEQIREALPL